MTLRLMEDHMLCRSGNGGASSDRNDNCSSQRLENQEWRLEREGVGGGPTKHQLEQP
jgi:hypothetical protein